MPTLSFPVKTAFVLSKTLNDTQTPPQPINGATVTCTLYAGRSARNPDQNPGTPISPINALILPYVSAGLYQTTVPGTLDPPLDGVGYVLVTDGVLGASPIYHSEEPVVITTAGDSIDLTTVNAVKQTAGLGIQPDGSIIPTSDDNEIQSAITGFSQYLLNWTGRDTLNSIQTFDEFYDGNGNSKLYLRNYPILSIITVIIRGITVPASGGVNTYGSYIGQSKKFIGMRGAIGNFTTFPYPNYSVYGGNTRGPIFIRGNSNVEVQYTAGYADVPPDLERAVCRMVAINYKRKSWLDQDSRTVAGGGSSNTTRYSQWPWPPEVELVFENYKRQAMIMS